MKDSNSDKSFSQWMESHPLSLFLLWSAWLALAFFFLGPDSYVRIWEDGETGLINKVMLSPRPGKGALGYWNPLQVAGYDNLSNVYLLNLDSLLFMILPGWLAYGLVMWVYRFIAGYFTYRLLRDFLDIDATSSIFAGLAYSLLPQFPMYYGLSIPGVSFFAWALLRLEKAGFLSYLLAFCIGIFFSLTSYFPFAIFTVPIIAFWIVFVSPRSTVKSWAMLALFVAGFLVIQWPILWAGALNAPLSHRAHWQFSAELRGIRFVLDIARPHAIPLAIALTGGFLSRGRNRSLLPFVAAYLFCFVFVAFYPKLHELVFSRISATRGFQLDRIYLMMPYLAICSAAIGIHCLRKRDPASSTDSPGKQIWSPFKATLVLAFGFLIFQSARVNVKTLSAALFGPNRWSAIYANPAILEFAKASESFAPFRVVTLGDTFHQHPAFEMAYGLESADGHVGVYSHRYHEFWEQVIWRLLQMDPDRGEFMAWGNRAYLFGKDFNLQLLSLANVRYVISGYPLENENLHLLPYGAANRDQQNSWWKTRNLGRKLYSLKHGFPGVPTYIYENRRAIPRFFLAENVKFFDESKTLLTALRSADFNELAATAYLIRGDVPEVPDDPLVKGKGRVALNSYSADKIVLEVSTSRNSILIVTNSYSPYWRARTDGVESRIFPADHTFQGLYVEKGFHEIVLEYVPPYAIRNWYQPVASLTSR